jgi:hypothetical protein
LLHYRTIIKLHNADIQQDRQCTCIVTSRCVRENIFSVEKQKVLHICLCVCLRARANVCARASGYVRVSVRACGHVHGDAPVVLLIQRVTRMHYILTSLVVSLTPPYFSKLSHKGHNFLKKKLDIKFCFDFL